MRHTTASQVKVTHEVRVIPLPGIVAECHDLLVVHLEGIEAASPDLAGHLKDVSFDD